MLKLLAVIATLVIATLLFTYRLTDVPPGINGDEAAIGINAALISKTGRDSNHLFLPLFSNTEYSPDWKQPVTIYTTALIFKVFGISYFSLRVVSILFVIISALIIYLLIKEALDEKIAIVGAILYFFTPIVMIQSHLALENITPVLFVSLWLLMLIKYSKNHNGKLLFFAGVFLGISILAYLGMRLIAPILGILSLFYIYYQNKSKRKFFYHTTLFIIGGVIFLLLLLLSKYYYPGVLFGQYRTYKIENYQSFILPYLSSFDPSFLFLKGDSTPYHSTGKQGMFLLVSLPFFIAGIVGIIKGTNPILKFILVSFFTAPILFGIGSTVYRASRLLALIPLYILIISVGVKVIIGIKGKVFRIAVLALILAMIALNYLDFLRDYWFEYPQRIKAEFAKPIHTTYQNLADAAKQYNLNPYVEYYLFKQYPGEDEFLRLVYFPQGLQEWYREKKVPPKSIILSDLSDFPKKNELDIVRIGNLDYYFIINQSENEI